MDVRRATAADAAVMRALWDELTAEATFTPYPGAPFTESLLTEHIALVAEDSGEAVGSVYANTSSRHFGFVFALYVRPARRRQGAARALMRAIAECLRDHGKQYVILSVDSPNTAARSFYERLGFVDQARILRAEVGALLDRP